MKLNLFFLTILAGAVFAAALYRQDAAAARQLSRMYRQNQQVLLSRLQRIYDEKIAIEQQNAALEAAASQDAAFDWNADISASPVIKRLQKKRIRLP